MRQHAKQYPKILFLASLIGLCLSLSACGGGGGSSSATASTATIGGSAGDGPIVGGTVTVTDDHGALIASTTTDANAHYSISVPSTAATPLTITVTGGTDQVTGTAPSFDLKSALTSLSTSATNTANVNPLSTVAVEEATALGGITSGHLSTAVADVRAALGFGVDSTDSSFDPISTPVTGTSVSSVVKANEAVAELIRRSTKASGQSISDVVSGIADDLTDGVIDGQAKAGATNTYVSAKFAAQVQSNMASISDEVIANTLKITDTSGNTVVKGADSTAKMDDAAKLSNDGTAPTTTVAQVHVTAAFIKQAEKAVNTTINLATATGASTAELDKLKTDLTNMTAGTAEDAITLTTTVSTLESEADRTAANADTATSSELSGATKIASDTEAPNPPSITSPAANATVTTATPTISGTAEDDSTVKVYNGTTLLGTATTNSNAAWSLTSSSLGNGTVTLTATATDEAGNTSAASSGVTITVSAP